MTSLVILMAAVVAVVGLLWLFQRRLIYLPSGRVPPIDQVLPGGEEVDFETEDGLTLAAWFLAGSGDTTVLVFNGNAGNRADRAPLARALQRRGMSVMVFDYRGFGGQVGRPSEKGLAADARAAVDYLGSRPDVDRSRIVYFGESLGSGVAVQLAQQTSPFVLVLRSPFTSLPDVGRFHYPFLPTGLLLWDKFPNMELIDNVRAPVLIAAGEADSIVPASQSRQLFEAAAEPKRWLLIEGADHNDPELTSGEMLVEAVVNLLEDVPGDP